MSHIVRSGASRIIEGVMRFQRRVFHSKESLFADLRKGQAPLALFITCSDSRINPNLLTQTEPGELFILRNAGNVIPPHSNPTSGEEATVEYALVHLKVWDIILCGHSHCGAVSGLLNPQALKSSPQVAQWLAHAQGVLAQVQQNGRGLSKDETLNLAVECNVLLQIEHLKTYPAVQRALAAGKLWLHAWVYHFETGKVTIHDPQTDRFVALPETPRHQLLHPHVADDTPTTELNISI